MRRFLLEGSVGQNFSVECLNCGARESYPQKGYGRIAAQIFQQDHACKTEVAS